MYRKILVVFVFVMFGLAMNTQAREKTLVTGATTSGSVTWGNPCLNTGKVSLIIETSGGSVDIAFQVSEETDEVPTLSFTSSSAEKVKYVNKSGTGIIKITYTITSGTVAKIVVRCN